MSLSAAMLEDDELARDLYFTICRRPDEKHIAWAATVQYKKPKDGEYAKPRYFSAKELKVSAAPSKAYDKRFEEIRDVHDGSANSIFRILVPEYADGLEKYIIAEAIRDSARARRLHGTVCGVPEVVQRRQGQGPPASGRVRVLPQRHRGIPASLRGGVGNRQLQAPSRAETGAVAGTCDRAVAGTCGTREGGRMTKKWDPTKKTSRWDPRREFDIIGVGVDGSGVWRDYGEPRRVIVTRKGENPRSVAERNEKHEREQREKKGQ
jgi:hypothetical protein